MKNNNLLKLYTIQDCDLNNVLETRLTKIMLDK